MHLQWDSGENPPGFVFANSIPASKHVVRGAAYTETRSYGAFVAQANTEKPRFEKNALFKWLSDREYGTPEYTGSFLTQWADNIVARVIGYTDDLSQDPDKNQRAKYEQLRDMPGIMDLMLQAQQAELDSLYDQMGVIEDGVENKYSIPTLRDALEETKELKEEVQDHIHELEGKHRLYAEERADLEHEQGRFYRQAVDKLKKYLRGETFEQLMEKARETPRQDDDRLVANLERINSDLSNLNREYELLSERQSDIAQKLDGLQDIRRHFTDQGYDGSYSYLGDDLDLDGFLVGYLAGQFSVRDVNSAIDAGQFFDEPEPVYTPTISSPTTTYTPTSTWSSGSSMTSGLGGGGGSTMTGGV